MPQVDLSRLFKSTPRSSQNPLSKNLDIYAMSLYLLITEHFILCIFITAMLRVMFWLKRLIFVFILYHSLPSLQTSIPLFVYCLELKLKLLNYLKVVHSGNSSLIFCDIEVLAEKCSLAATALHDSSENVVVEECNSVTVTVTWVICGLADQPTGNLRTINLRTVLVECGPWVICGPQICGPTETSGKC